MERSLEGDRTFAGFGKAAADEYADCFIDADKLPEEKLKVNFSQLCDISGSTRASLNSVSRQSIQQRLEVTQGTGRAADTLKCGQGLLILP